MIIGGGVVVVVILIAVATMGGEKEVPPQDPPAKSANTEAETPKESSKPARSKSRGTSKRVLTDPDTPAPAIASGVLTEGNAMYTKAKKQHDDARRAQAAGEGAKFNSLINDSWDTLAELDKKLETYSEWLEEADMESWRVPSSYSGLQRLIEKYYPLKGKIKRIKPNRR